MRVQVHVVVRLTESRKETRLSLTNRAMHLCKCNGVADLKHVSHTYYRAKFGRSALKGVGINTEEPKKLGSALEHRSLRMRDVANTKIYAPPHIETDMDR